jgi:phosphopantetheinyl transferase
MFTVIQENNSINISNILHDFSLREIQLYNIRSFHQKKGFLYGRFLLKRLLIHHYGGKMIDYEILSDANGKPYISQKLDIFCSISHSKKYTAISLSKKSYYGIDIEDNKKPHPALLDYILTPENKIFFN